MTTSAIAAGESGIRSGSTKKGAGSVALHERADALATVNAWIAEHQDEVLLNGGALPEELEQLLDEAEGDFRAKVERVAMKRRELQGNASTAKVEKDYYAQREKMWSNADAALRAYLHRSMERAGETSVKTALATIWLQDSPPSLSHSYSGAELLEIADEAEAIREGEVAGCITPLEHHLARFITVERVARLDGRAVLAAYQAREAALVEEAAALELTDKERVLVLADAEDWIRGEEEAGGASADGEWAKRICQGALDEALATKRAEHVRETLDREFPGVRVTQSQHVRQR